MPHIERRFGSIDSLETNSTWCIIADNGNVYPFGMKSVAEEVLNKTLQGTDDFTEYNKWSPDYAPVTEIEWCKHYVQQYYPYASVFLGPHHTYYVNGAGRSFGEAGTRLEAWRLAEQVVKQEREGVRPGAVRYEPVKVFAGEWRTVTDFTPNTTSSIDYINVYQTNPTGESELLLGQIRGEEDGQRQTVSSICADCGFSRISSGYFLECSQCGGGTITHATLANNG